MKTSLFTTLAGLAAGTALSHAATTTIDLLNQVPLVSENTSQIHWVSGSRGPGWTDNIGKPGQCTADNLLTDINAVPSLGASTGWQAAVSNLSLGNSDISSVTADGFNFIGRNGYGGEFVLLTIRLDDLGLTEKDSLSSLSISGTAAGSSFGVSLFGYDSGSSTMTLLDSVRRSGDFSISASDLSLSSGDVVYLLFSSTSAGASNTVSSLNMTATVESIPEPSAALLLPCALVAATLRRRRK